MDLTKRNEVRRTTATLFHRDSHADVPKDLASAIVKVLVAR
jgi:hypothetical protein